MLGNIYFPVGNKGMYDQRFDNKPFMLEASLIWLGIYSRITLDIELKKVFIHKPTSDLVGRITQLVTLHCNTWYKS